VKQISLFAGTSSDWDVQVFIVPYLFEKHNYKFPGFLLWFRRFAVIYRVGCGSNALWISNNIQFILKECSAVPSFCLHLPSYIPPLTFFDLFLYLHCYSSYFFLGSFIVLLVVSFLFLFLYFWIICKKYVTLFGSRWAANVFVTPNVNTIYATMCQQKQGIDYFTSPIRN
jgi:hypothetical protein